MVIASCAGKRNALKIGGYGDNGGLEWQLENPITLWVTSLNDPKRLITRNGTGAGDVAARISCNPPGHPEGILKGFSNTYSEAAEAILAERAGISVPPDVALPTVYKGLKGMAYVDVCLRSSSRNLAWVMLPD